MNHNIKKIDNSENKIYKIFATNKIIKDKIDEYLQNKNNIKNKEKITFLEFKILLFEFVKENNRCPLYTEKYKNNKLGYLFFYQKNKIKSINDKLYIAFSENITIKNNLDKFLKINI
jgi:hypothetical protein